MQERYAQEWSISIRDAADTRSIDTGFDRLAAKVAKKAKRDKAKSKKKAPKKKAAPDSLDEDEEEDELAENEAS